MGGVPGVQGVLKAVGLFKGLVDKQRHKYRELIYNKNIKAHAIIHPLQAFCKKRTSYKSSRAHFSFSPLRRKENETHTIALYDNPILTVYRACI